MISSLGSGEVIWKPLPKQQIALACPAFEMLYGGSKGGAKTNFLVACVAPILALAHRKWTETGREQRKCRIMVFRKNLDDLDDFVAKSFELYPYLDPQMGAGGWHEKAKMWRFSSQASVELNHLDGPKAHESHNGHEFAALLIDEVQFVAFEAYSFLLAQVRSSDPDYRAVNMVRCTANPGGPYGDWVKKHFHIDECPEGGKIFRHQVRLPNGQTRELTRAFIRSFLRDNPYLDPDGMYEARLRGTMTPEEVRMYMDGDFDVVAGAMFSHLIRPSVHFVKSHPIPGRWEMIHATDWGSSSPACTLWGARDNDGRVYIVDELHQPGITGRVYGEAMVQKYKHQKWSSDRVWKVDDFWGVIDKQAMDRYGSEATAAAGIMEYGHRIFQADKLPGERVVGINQIRERLLLNRLGQPQLVVFEDRCPNLVRALKGIPSKAPIDPEDYDEGSPLAHAADALRFMLMRWPVQRPETKNPLDAEVARWDRILRSQRQEGDDGKMTGGYDG